MNPGRQVLNERLWNTQMGEEAQLSAQRDLSQLCAGYTNFETLKNQTSFYVHPNTKEVMGKIYQSLPSEIHMLPSRDPPWSSGDLAQIQCRCSSPIHRSDPCDEPCSNPKFTGPR